MKQISLSAVGLIALHNTVHFLHHQNLSNEISSNFFTLKECKAFLYLSARSHSSLTDRRIQNSARERGLMQYEVNLMAEAELESAALKTTSAGRRRACRCMEINIILKLGESPARFVWHTITSTTRPVASSSAPSINLADNKTSYSTGSL